METTRKLHLGNGTIYLAGYINIDLQLPHHHLALVRPDLVEKNVTTVDNYYKEEVTRDTIEAKSRHFKEVVCDMFADIKDLPFQENSIDEIRLIQVFEHFSFAEGKDLLVKWLKLLRAGGKLHLDVPDLDGTIDLYNSAQNDLDKQWAIRLLYGSQKNEHGFHKGMYTKALLATLLAEVGYSSITILPNIHFYPAFAIEGVKLNEKK